VAGLFELMSLRPAWAIKRDSHLKNKAKKRKGKKNYGIIELPINIIKVLFLINNLNFKMFPHLTFILLSFKLT
jgi:hypothetical protein